MLFLAIAPAEASIWDRIVKSFRRDAVVENNQQNQVDQLTAKKALNDQIVDHTFFNALPESIRQWHDAETALLSRKVDDVRLMSPETNLQNPLFSPEAGHVFQLWGYWIDVPNLIVHQNSMSPYLKQTFFRNHNGREQMLFLVHPESYAFYKDKIQFAGLDRELFFATATASSRSLIAWKRGDEANAFIAKVSLAAKIGGVDRTIKGTEAASSVGIDRILVGASDLSKDFKVFREVMSAVPKGMERGAMIVRQIPSEMSQGTVRAVPFFSLYAEPSDGRKPLLLQMIENQRNIGINESPRDFVENRIIRPFVKQWLRLAIENNLVTEPHAQNVMLVIDGNLMPTGTFIHRDFGGFNIDILTRKSRGLFVPEVLPTFTGSIEKDYYFDAHIENFRTSMNNYFDAGFVHNIEHSIQKWQNKGLISASFNRSELGMRLVSILSEEIGSYLDVPMAVNSDYSNLSKLVDSARQNFYTKKANLCSQIL
jgi:hypothetical protein